MTDDELFDLYMTENETVIASLRKIYNKGKEDAIHDFADFICLYFNDPWLCDKPEKCIELYKKSLKEDK